MTVEAERQFFRLDEFESHTSPSKIEVLDAIEDGNAPLFIKCKNQKGLLFSVVENKAVAHCLGSYTGHLELTPEASIALAENDSYIVKVGTIHEPQKLKISDQVLESSLFGVYENYEETNIEPNKTYGFYLNVITLGHDLEETFDANRRVQRLSRDPYTFGLDIDPLSEISGTKRDAVVLGNQFKLANARISLSDIENIKDVNHSSKQQTEKTFRRTGFNLMLIRILKVNIHFTADEVWRVVENEINSEDPKYDIDRILVAPDEDVTNELHVGWIDNKKVKNIVYYKSFPQRLSRLRTSSNLKKK